MKFSKVEKSWIMYDWANSVYAIVVMSAIFPIYITGILESQGQSGDYWWGIATTIGTAVAAIAAPFLGALADYKGMKKKLFTAFLLVGLAATLVCAFADQWYLLLIGYAISYIGFSGSCLFYDSFLTDVTTKERMDSVSAWGFSMGYIGGSTIPFLVCIALVSFGSAFGIDGTLAVKISLIITVIWWAVFSIPFMRNCKQLYAKQTPPSRLIQASFRSMLHTAKSIVTNRSMFLFVLAYFFYIDGVNTVIRMSTAYGTTLGIDSTGMIIALLVTQLIAFPCAILFGKVAGKFGTIPMLIFSNTLYLFICILGFIMGYGIEEQFLTIDQALVIFWILAVLIGTVQGGIQALSRSHFGKMVPKEQSNEYFGVFDIFGKFAAVMGPALYTISLGVSGRSSVAILSIISLFLLGGVCLLLYRRHERVATK